MRFKKKTFKDWHKWFAWYPVELGNGDKIWLETVMRRGEKVDNYSSFSGIEYAHWTYEYKELEK